MHIRSMSMSMSIINNLYSASPRIVTFDHHLDDRLNLYHVSDDGVTSIHNIHCSVATVALVEVILSSN